jgi:hypothetical protein
VRKFHSLVADVLDDSSAAAVVERALAFDGDDPVRAITGLVAGTAEH